MSPALTTSLYKNCHALSLLLTLPIPPCTYPPTPPTPTPCFTFLHSTYRQLTFIGLLLSSVSSSLNYQLQEGRVCFVHQNIPNFGTVPSIRRTSINTY